MNEQDVVSFFTNKGYEPHQAAGIAGNLMQESSLNPTAKNATSGAFGFAQWLGPRKKAFMDFAMKAKKDITDPLVQLEFIDHELNTTESKAKDKLLTSKDALEAAINFSNHYERAGANEKKNATRANYANKILSAIIPSVQAGETMDNENKNDGTTIYKVKDPHGVLHKIRGPKGASDDEIIAQAQLLFPEIAPETTFEGNIRKLKDTGFGALRSGATVAGVIAKPFLSSAEWEKKNRATNELFSKYADTTSPDYKGGQFLGDVAITAPLGSMVSEPLKLLAPYVPKLEPVLNVLADAVSSGGITKTKAKTVARDYTARLIGAGGLGAATSGILGGNTEDMLTGAGISALIPGLGQPLAGALHTYGKKMFTPTYNALIEAVGNKSPQILNALRAPQQELVAGSMPTASEVASSVGSPQLSELGQIVKPFAPEEYAAREAMTNKARLNQKARIDKSIANEQKALTNTITDVSPRETGKKLIELGEAERENIKKTITTPAYTAAFKEAGNTKTNVEKVLSEAENILERPLSDFKPESAPKTVRLLKTFKPKPVAKTVYNPITMRNTTETIELPAEATLQQLDDVRKAINADVALAKSGMSPMNDTTLHNLMQLHKAIDDAVKESTTLSPKAKDLYAEALNKYRTIYVPKAKTGVNKQLFKQTSLNEPKLEADNVIKTYFQPKGEREASQFVELFGNNAEAKATAEKGIENLYREAVVNADGIVDPAKHAKFMKDYARPLAIFDNAGLKLTPKLTAIGNKAKILAEKEMLTPNIKPLPSNIYANKFENELAQKTRNFTPEQLADVNALKNDVDREMENLRLASFANKKELLSDTPSAQMPHWFSGIITVYNHIINRLQGKMNDNAKKELAIVMLKPYATADLIEKALANQAKTEATKATAAKVLKPTALGVRNALAVQQQNQNALAQ